eukprot:2876977-Amphidinium_carterae.4
MLQQSSQSLYIAKRCNRSSLLVFSRMFRLQGEIAEAASSIEDHSIVLPFSACQRQELTRTLPQVVQLVVCNIAAKWLSMGCFLGECLEMCADWQALPRSQQDMSGQMGKHLSDASTLQSE